MANEVNFRAEEKEECACSVDTEISAENSPVEVALSDDEPLGVDIDLGDVIDAEVSTVEHLSVEVQGEGGLDVEVQQITETPNGENPFAVLYVSQTLTYEQKRQARENIESAGPEEIGWLNEKVSNIQKTLLEKMEYYIIRGRYRTNGDLLDAVEIFPRGENHYIGLRDAILGKMYVVARLVSDDGLYTEEFAVQYLSEEENYVRFIQTVSTSKIRGFEIWADGTVYVWNDHQEGGGGTESAAAVLYTEQTLTEAQKAQARKNIGAAAVGEGGTVGSLTFEDDGAGNVTIVTTGGTLKFTDDGNGNITMGVA